MINSFVNWLFVNWLTSDYETAKVKETAEIIARYSRGNVSIQNGWYLESADVDKLSSEGDKALVNLAKRIPELRDAGVRRGRKASRLIHVRD